MPRHIVLNSLQDVFKWSKVFCNTCTHTLTQMRKNANLATNCTIILLSTGREQQIVHKQSHTDYHGYSELYCCMQNTVICICRVLYVNRDTVTYHWIILCTVCCFKKLNLIPSCWVCLWACTAHCWHTSAGLSIVISGGTVNTLPQRFSIKHHLCYHFRPTIKWHEHLLLFSERLWALSSDFTQIEITKNISLSSSCLRSQEHGGAVRLFQMDAVLVSKRDIAACLLKSSCYAYKPPL